MTDAELSLAVAKIMYPEYEWGEYGGVVLSDHDGMEFSYTDKACAFDMSVWLGKQYYSEENPADSLRYQPKLSSVRLRSILGTRCPQHALAMAIKEIKCGEL